jgi:hypothetical protein
MGALRQNSCRIRSLSRVETVVPTSKTERTKVYVLILHVIRKKHRLCNYNRSRLISDVKVMRFMRVKGRLTNRTENDIPAPTIFWNGWNLMGARGDSDEARPRRRRELT